MPLKTPEDFQRAETCLRHSQLYLCTEPLSNEHVEHQGLGNIWGKLAEILSVFLLWANKCLPGAIVEKKSMLSNIIRESKI